MNEDSRWFPIYNNWSIPVKVRDLRGWLRYLGKHVDNFTAKITFTPLEKFFPQSCGGANIDKDDQVQAAVYTSVTKVPFVYIGQERKKGKARSGVYKTGIRSVFSARAAQPSEGVRNRFTSISRPPAYWLSSLLLLLAPGLRWWQLHSVWLCRLQSGSIWHNCPNSGLYSFPSCYIKLALLKWKVLRANVWIKVCVSKCGWKLPLTDVHQMILYEISGDKRETNCETTNISFVDSHCGSSQ